MVAPLMIEKPVSRPVLILSDVVTLCRTMPPFSLNVADSDGSCMPTKRPIATLTKTPMKRIAIALPKTPNALRLTLLSATLKLRPNAMQKVMAKVVVEAVPKAGIPKVLNPLPMVTR